MKYEEWKIVNGKGQTISYSLRRNVICVERINQSFRGDVAARYSSLRVQHSS